VSEPAEFDVFNCELDGVNLIEASAGTGKTWNICGLYLRLLLERGLEVQKILVVTFTKAATAELRERVRAGIVETLATLRQADPATAGADPFPRKLVQAVEQRSRVPRPQLVRLLEQALEFFDESVNRGLIGRRKLELERIFVLRVLAVLGIAFAIDANRVRLPRRIGEKHIKVSRHAAGGIHRVGGPPPIAGAQGIHPRTEQA